MAFAANEVVISRDAMTVYGFLMDGMNNPLWRTGVRSIALRSGVRGQKGALYQQTVTGPGGRPVAADFRITDARPGAEVRYAVVTGPARPTGASTSAPKATPPASGSPLSTTQRVCGSS
ncbi:hypothetical protein [Paenarthrobacter aurescens]|uniref:hypothetical protein n=1 Tax=Paenarthrobacter aurescens TaxID=43663 RepID=UPI003384647F